MWPGWPWALAVLPILAAPIAAASAKQLMSSTDVLEYASIAALVVASSGVPSIVAALRLRRTLGGQVLAIAVAALATAFGAFSAFALTSLFSQVS